MMQEVANTKDDRTDMTVRLLPLPFHQSMHILLILCLKFLSTSKRVLDSWHLKQKNYLRLQTNLLTYFSHLGQRLN